MTGPSPTLTKAAAPASATPPAVAFHDVGKTFTRGKSRVTALDGITTQVERGRIVAVIGFSGAGKSTLINTLVGRRAAKTGDEPGITKIEQKIVLENGFYLFDTPGMLWPKIIVEESGYNLAASGAVGRNALDEEEDGELEHLTKRRNVFLASGLGQLAESECKTLSRADLQSCAAENGVMRGAVPRIT